MSLRVNAKSPYEGLIPFGLCNQENTSSVPVAFSLHALISVNRIKLVQFRVINNPYTLLNHHIPHSCLCIASFRHTLYYKGLRR